MCLCAVLTARSATASTTVDHMLTLNDGPQQGVVHGKEWHCKSSAMVNGNTTSPPPADAQKTTRKQSVRATVHIWRETLELQLFKCAISFMSTVYFQAENPNHYVKGVNLWNDRLKE